MHLFIQSENVFTIEDYINIHQHARKKLTARHRALRLQFAEHHLDWVIEDWAKVIFSNEKLFSSTDHEKLHCWRLYITRYNRSNIHEEARSEHVIANM